MAETDIRWTAPDRRTLMWAALALWTVVYIAWTMDWVLQPMAFAVERALRRVPVCLIGAGFCLLIGGGLKRIAPRPLATRIASAAGFSLVAALAEAAISQIAFYVLVPRWGSANLVDWIANAMLVFWIFAAWSALYFALAADASARANLTELARARSALMDARHRALLQQIDPHFLFNALNTLSGLVMDGDARGAERVIVALSALMRDRLKLEPVAFHRLGEELALQKAYLDVQAARFPDRLRLVADVSPGLLDRTVPAHILQPVIENVFTHGVSQSSDVVTVTVTAEMTAAGLCLRVRDDAKGGTRHTGTGVGLANVRDRLALLHGPAGRIEAGPISPNGWQVEILLP